MKRIDRKQREQQFESMAAQALSQHTILPSSRPGCWQIGKPGTCVYRAEVLVTYCSSLIIHGDVDLVNFYSYCGEGGAEGVVRWVARSGPDYLASKAARGTGREVAYCYDPEVALDDAWSYVEDGEKDPESYSRGWKDDWRQVVQAVMRGDHPMEIGQLIYELTDDAEYCSIGECPAPRVMWGKHLAAKLADLIHSGN